MTRPVFVATMPLPPSTNNLFFTLKGNGRRVKTTAYKDWIDKAGQTLLRQWQDAGSPKWADKQPASLVLRVGLEGRRRDLSNVLKPVEDLIVSTLPVPDDRYNDAIALVRDDTLAGMVEMRFG